MVTRANRTRSKRRVFVRSPSGKVNLHLEKRKPIAPKCGSCGAILKGVARVRASMLKTLSKTKKRPERPYGGVLCGKCMRAKMVARAVSK
jgi:large subunit ribosomal protein L34e